MVPVGVMYRVYALEGESVAEPLQLGGHPGNCSMDLFLAPDTLHWKQ